MFNTDIGVFKKSQSFSGCDIIPIIYGTVPDKTIKDIDGKSITTYKPTLFTLGMLTTVSYSTHTDKRPVTPCGTRRPKGFTSGIQTTAGSMIFTVLNDHPLAGMLDDSLGDVLQATNDISLLPGFDLTIIIANEAGSMSVLNIFGIEFIDEGFTASVNDVYSELTTQYICRDVSMLKNISTKDMNKIYMSSNKYMGIK